MLGSVRELHIFHTFGRRNTWNKKKITVMGRCVRGKSMIHGLKQSGAVSYVQGVSDL